MGWKGKDPYEGERPEATLGVSFSQRLSVWLGTGCGLGLVAPVMPGTFGSLPGVGLAVLFAYWLPVCELRGCGDIHEVEGWLLHLVLQFAICLILMFLAVPICTITERALKKKDDGRITADEWMLYPIATIGLPLLETWWLIPLTFVVIRTLDILKLPPARQVQYWPEGWGIMADDAISQLYALGINWGLWIWLSSLTCAA